MRLWGIDCPELKQAYGEAARDFLAKRVEGRVVQLRTHGEDNYGRILAEVLLGGRNVNADLVAAGLAWWHRKYTPDAHDLAELECQAGAARWGLWSQAAPVAPWDFRHPSARLADSHTSLTHIKCAA